MNRMPFFLTPNQRHNAGQGVPEHPLQLGERSKASEAVKLVKGLFDLHRPIPYLLQPKSVKFLKNLYRQQTTKNDPH